MGLEEYTSQLWGVFFVANNVFDDYVNGFVSAMFNSLVYGGASRIGHLYTNSNGTSFKSDINNDLAMPQYKTAKDTTAEVATGIKTPENDTEVNYTDYVNDETLNVGFSEFLNNQDVNYDVDLAISNIINGRATEVDFEHFKPGNTANRQAFYETTGIKLPEDSRLSNYILNALNNKEKRIRDIYLKHNTNSLKQPDSLTLGDEDGIINEKSSLSLKEFSYVKEKTGWSDDVVNYIRTLEEADVYINAGLKEVQVGDRKVLIRSDIDLDMVTPEGDTNRERMNKGKAPYTKSGEKIELHHIGQKNESPLAELAKTEHRGKGRHGKLHNLKMKSKVDHDNFNSDREMYWKERLKNMELEEKLYE